MIMVGKRPLLIIGLGVKTGHWSSHMVDRRPPRKIATIGEVLMISKYDKEWYSEAWRCLCHTVWWYSCN